MEYKAVHNQNLHYASIYKRNKLVASSRNSVGSRSRGCGWSKNTIHAEIAAVKQLGDLTKLQGCVLVVVRVNKQGELRESAAIGQDSDVVLSIGEGGDESVRCLRVEKNRHGARKVNITVSFDGAHGVITEHVAK